MSPNQCFRLLNLSPTATVSEIKKAYRKQAMQWHPDRNKTPEAAHRFKQVKTAYTTLLDYKAGKISAAQRPTQTNRQRTQAQKHRDPSYRANDPRRRKKKPSANEIRMHAYNDALRKTNLFLIPSYLFFGLLYFLAIEKFTVAAVIGSLFVYFFPVVVVYYTASLSVLRRISFTMKKHTIKNSPWLHAIIFGNMAIWAAVGSRTCISFFALTLAYLATTFLGIFLYDRLPQNIRKFSVAILPSFLSLFLLLNFLIPSSKVYFACPVGMETNVERLDDYPYNSEPLIFFKYFYEVEDLKGYFGLQMKTGGLGIPVSSGVKVFSLENLPNYSEEYNKYWHLTRPERMQIMVEWGKRQVQVSMASSANPLTVEQLDIDVISQ